MSDISYTIKYKGKSYNYEIDEKATLMVESKNGHLYFDGEETADLYKFLFVFFKKFPNITDGRLLNYLNGDDYRYE